ncbi:glycosyltransferase family 39 protein [Candidatus Calescamantes bacterium]|nr:glycosyltransferase family 39 protein [Candidatus Calescamantes bacterium]
MRKERKKYLIFHFLLIFFHLLLNLLILEKDNVPFSFDEGGIYQISREYYKNLLKHPPADLGRIYRIYYSFTSFYPPLYMLSHLPIFILFGEGEDQSVVTNFFYLSLLIWIIYLLGKEFWNEKKGFLFACLLSIFPSIGGFSRTEFPVISLTFFLFLSLYLLLKTDGFKKTKYSFLSGISVGCGILTKLYFPVYIFPPLILEAFKIRNKNSFLNFLLFLLVCFVLVGSWLIPNLATGLFFKEKEELLGKLYKNPVNLEGSAIYLCSFWKQMSPPFFLLFLFSFPLYLRNWQGMKKVILTAFLFPLFFFTFLGFKQGRYILPLLPFMAIIISSAWEKKGETLLWIFISLGFLQLLKPALFSSPHLGFTHQDYVERRRYGLISPHRVEWPIEKIRNIVISLGKEEITVKAIGISPFISALDYKFLLWKEIEGEKEFEKVQFLPLLISPHFSKRENIGDAELLIWEEGIAQKIKEDEKRVKYLWELMKEFEEKRRKYYLLEILNTSECSYYLYVRKDEG